MWSDVYLPVCRSHPGLVAVYESPDGTLAFLLRQDLVPVPEERVEWVAAIRDTASAATRDLRAAGLDGVPVVLQWQALPEIAQVLDTWRCRHSGDRERHAELVDAARAWAEDADGLAARQLACLGRLESVAADGPPRRLVTPELVAWYRDMMPAWLDVQPIARRALVFRAHRWVMERLLTPPVPAGHARRDLAPVGILSVGLVRTLPRGEFARWAPWIRLLRRDFQRALLWPVEQRGQAWARWLFLIPYSIPVPRHRGGPVSRPAVIRPVARRRARPGSVAPVDRQPA